MTTKELILICAGGVKGYLDVGEKDTLEDVRCLIEEELDDDLIMPNFAFHVDDIRISNKQEKKKLAWQILNKVVSIQPKRSRTLEEDVDNVQSPSPKKQKRASEAIKSEVQLVSKDSKPLPCEKPTGDAAVVENSNSFQNETNETSSAINGKTGPRKSYRFSKNHDRRGNAIPIPERNNVESLNDSPKEHDILEIDDSDESQDNNLSRCADNFFKTTHQNNTDQMGKSEYSRHNSIVEIHDTEARASGSATQMTNAETFTTDDKYSAKGSVEEVQDKIGTTIFKRIFQGQISDIDMRNADTIHKMLFYEDSKPLPCEKPTGEAAVVKNSNSSQNETNETSSAISDKTGPRKSSKEVVSAMANADAIVNGSDNVGSSDRSRDDTLQTRKGEVFCTAQTVKEENEKPPEPQSPLATSKNKNNTGNADGDLEDDLGGDESSSSSSYKRLKKNGKAKKKKKKKSSKSKRRSKGDFDDDDEIHASADHQQSDDNAPTKGKRKAAHQSADYYKAKKEFERHRDDILAHIPRHIKEGFREIGFTKWGKTFLPVIQLSPFDIEPGKTRNQWMKMFEHCRMKRRPMTVLIYWYGVAWEHRWDSYSFIPKNKFHSYEEGVSKGFNILPPKIEKKMQSRKILSIVEEQQINGLAQLEEELERPKED